VLLRPLVAISLVAVAIAAAPAGRAVAAASATPSNPVPRIWVANTPANTLTEYSGSAGADATPIVTISSSSGSLNEPEDVALDGHGDLWVADTGSDAVVEYAKDQLAASGTPTPALTLGAAGGLDRPAGLAFDAAGDLWVSNAGNDTVVEYTARQLAQGSDASPATTITSTPDGSLDGPGLLAFDAEGDLWVPNISGDTISEFAASSLTQGGPEQATMITSVSGSGSLDEPFALRFDAAGDLSVVNRGDGSVLQYESSQLGGGGQMAPEESFVSGSLSVPQGAGFDTAGDLWVANGGSDTIADFSAAALAVGGSAATSTISSSALAGPTGLTVAQAPTVTSVISTQAPAGTTVGISGAGFYPGATVDFGSTPATSVTYVSAYKLTAVAPPGSGTVDVTVTTGEGTSAPSSADQFTYGGFRPTLVASNVADGAITFDPLGVSGDYHPTELISAIPSSPLGMALDGAGDLWVTTENGAGGGAIWEYTRQQLQDGDLNAPAVTLQPQGANGFPWALAFDSSGNLWVSELQSAGGSPTGTVLEFLKRQLAGGSQAPALALASGVVQGIAFDAHGDLWVSDAQADTISEYGASQLVPNGSRTPSAVLQSDGSNSLAEPLGLTFDSGGDLWVANQTAGSLVKYTPAQLQTGSPVPAVTITPDTGDPAFGPSQLTFDSAGNAWVAGYDSQSGGIGTAVGRIIELSPSMLSASGGPIPADTIEGATTGLDQTVGLALEQAPTVTGVSPAGGPDTGGTTVTISGTGFYPGSTVDFGSEPSPSVSYVSPYQLTAVAPTGSGAVDVTITTGEGTSATSAADRFSYPVPPSQGTSASTPAKVSAGHAAHPRLVLESRRLDAIADAVQLPLRCSDAACRGTIELTEQVEVIVTRGRHHRRQRRTVVLGTASYQLAAGHSRTVRLTLNRAGRGALAHARRHRLAVRLTATVAGGQKVETSVTLTQQPARTRKRTR
ncbi:MAG: IPT/TIG domain-containing protein, partial [Solirubrobacteraceae bacterium]